MASEQYIRVGDTLTNILDSKTGEPVTYTKVTTYTDGSAMTDLKTDGTIYRKLGTEYFKRNYSGYANIKWFGAKGDGIIDNTTIINKALSIDNLLIEFSDGDFKCNLVTLSGDNITINLENCTISANQFSITGSNCIINANNNKIKHILRYAKVVTLSPAGATSMTLDSMPFQIGDGVSNSYGMGGDGSNPITITNIIGNTIYYNTPNFLDVPVNSYTGNFSFSATFRVEAGAKNIKVRNLEINRSTGYAFLIGQEADVEFDGLTTTETGLDVAIMRDGSKCRMLNSHLGRIIDAAKQGISADGNIDFYGLNTTFARDNSDVEFYLFAGQTGGTKIVCDNCIFDGRATGYHPAPYNLPSFACVSFAQSDNTQLYDLIDFNNCTFYDYTQGIINQPSGFTWTGTVDTVRLTNSETIGCTLYAAQYIKPNTFISTNNTHTSPDLTVASEFVLLSNTGRNIITDNTWINDKSNKGFANASLINNKFINSAVVNINEFCTVDGMHLENTQLVYYPFFEENHRGRVHNLTIKHDQFLSLPLTSIVNLRPSSGAYLKFRNLNGTLDAVMFTQTFNQGFIFPSIKHIALNVSLYGDDVIIPAGSVFEDISVNSSTGRKLYVDKSVTGTTNVASASGSTSVTISDASGAFIGARLAIQLVSKRVFFTRVNAVTGNTLTINALPEAVGQGALYSCLTLVS